MSSFAKGLLTGILLVFVFISMIGFVAVLASRGDPGIPPDTALVVDLEGGVPEHIDTELPAFLAGRGGGAPATLLGLTRAIRAAAEDPSVRALVLRCDGSRAGWAKAQEIRWAIQAFKESGKPVWAFLELAGREDYYIASLADRIVIQPLSFLELSGLRLEVMFFKGTMDKLGVSADLIRTGRYKTAGEPFSRAEMSPEWREVLNEMLDEFYRQLLDGIAEGRGEDGDHWRAVLDEGPFDAANAEQLGLVDAIADDDEFVDSLEEALEVEELHRMSVAAYLARSGSGRGRGERIAVMHAVGTIMSGESQSDPFSGLQDVLGAQTFNSHLQDLAEDESVAGVILRIDSPGGDAIASEQMLRAVRRLRAEKPVVISMSNLAASGGYYIASVPDVPIVAYPGTYTGSIGVFTIHLNLRELYGKLGISKEILTRGRYAGLNSDYKALSEDEREKVRAYVDLIYEEFLSRVSDGRGVGVDAVRDLAEGRVWIGTQASENGLVDELGGYPRAIELVKEAVGIGEDASVRIVTYPPRRSLLETLLSRGGRFALAKFFEPPPLGDARRAWAQATGWARRLRSGPMYMAPYTLSVE